jgi:hypothetical protein
MDGELAALPAAESESRVSLGPQLSWDSSVQAVPLGRGWDAEPIIVDWLGQGRADLLVSSGGGGSAREVWLYRALTVAAAGSAPCYDAGMRVPALDGLRCVCPIPNDRPSRFDLVALSESGLLHLPNAGAPHEPAFGPRRSLRLGPDLGIRHGRVIQIAAIDWDQDGLTDLLVGVHDLEGYWPDSDRLPSAQTVGLNQRAGHPGYDRDGLWRGRAPAGRIYWLRNMGGPGEPRFELQPEIKGEAGPLDLGLHPAPLAVAWGGRGNLELLVSDHRGLLRVYRNFGGQLPPVLMEPRTLKCGGAPVLLHDDRIAMSVGDIDGDGRAELIYGTSSGLLYSVHAGPSRDEATIPAPILHATKEIRLGGHAAICVCDLDGDGDMDIVYGDALGRLHYLQDLGSGDDHCYALPVIIEAAGAPFRIEPGPDGTLFGPAGQSLGYARPAVADWLGHGRPDLIVTGAGGDVLLLPNDGARTDPRFGHPIVMRCNGRPLIVPPCVQPAVACWSDPARPDLIALDLQGFLCAYPQTGRSEVGEPVFLVDHLGRVIRLDGSFALSGRCSIWAGPWTASGKIDLLIGLTRGNRHVIPSVTGCGLENLDSLPTVLLLENLGRGVVVPRPLLYSDGRPIVIGQEGCYPQGVRRAAGGLPDLLVGCDDGSLSWISRENLRS